MTCDNYSNNDIVLTPILVTLWNYTAQVIEEDGCQELSKVVGSYLLERLASLRDEFECVGDVRGKGLLLGMEMVQDKV